MKRITLLFIGSFFALAGLTVSAQNNRFNNVVEQSAGEKCGSAIIHDRLMKTDPAYRAKIQANEQLIQNIIQQQKQNKSGQNSTMATIYTIPVVVHVIHLGEAVGSGTNISAAQVQSAIDNLNQAYRNQSPYTGVDIEVEFALAQRDPNCNATTGINRVSGAGTSDYSTNGLTTSGTDNEATIKALSKWPNTTYYNIWVVAGIDGNMGGGGVQGFAYFPGASSSVDGAVILYNSFGYDPGGVLGYNLKSYTQLNVTTLHELGHAFNLYHTFEGDGGGGSCPTGDQCGSGLGDCCSDIPPHIRSASNCNTSGTNACDGGSSNTLFVHNIMDYSSDACQTEFTADQKTRMRAAIIGSRGSLVNSLATTAPSGSLPTSACIPVVINSGGFPIGVYGFTFNDLDVSSGTTNADGGYVDRTCYFQTTVTAGTNIPVTVNSGTAYNHDVRVYIDYNNDGDFADAGETVFSSDNVMTTHSGTIAIPASPPLTGQILRMRVYADYFTTTITDACDNPDYGQAEDFGLIINPAAGSPPVADFSGTPTTVCAGSSVSFTDLSTNSPTSWTWTFQGGTPSSSTSQNPTITYTAAGTYSVALTATNGSGSDGETKLAYITVNAVPTVTVSGTMTITAGGSTTLTATGATTYSWVPGTGLSATTGSVVTANPGSTTAYTTTGTSSGCSGTKTFTVTVNPVVGPTNLHVNSCGITETSLTQTLWCNQVSNAQQYRYELTDLSNGSVYYYIRTINASNFQMDWVSSVTYARTYSIKVAVMVGGNWSAYGVACNVTTPAAPTTKLHTNSCGITETSLSQTLWCNQVIGAQGYWYELTDISNGNMYTYLRSGNASNFQMNWVSSVTYGKTYSIRVAAVVGGVTLAYGVTCNVTTPAVPTTKLATASCGITETALNQVLYCDAVSNATQYRYELVDISNGNTYTYVRTTSLTNFQMDWVSGVTYGKTYSIRVAAYVGNTWLSYATACNVTTPAAPTTKLATAYCNIVETSFSQVLYCDAVTGATQYRYECVDISNGNSYYYTRTTNLTNFAMNWVSGVTTSKTYNVRVTSYVGGTWLPYGPTCSVTTAASFVHDPGDASLMEDNAEARIASAEGISLALYPNPNDGHVYLQVSSSAQVTVTNLLGETVYEGKVHEGTNELYFLDTKPGMYVIRVSDGVNAAQVRMVKE